MLPEDSKAHKAELHKTMQQLQVNDHFKVVPPEEKPRLYSNELFKEAAIQWLIETDQVSCISFKFCIFSLTLILAYSDI
jgi:hypothetical protein